MLRMRLVTDAEHEALHKIAHRARNGILRIRALVVREMARTNRISMAARAGGVSPQYAREIIHRFSIDGLDSLAPRHAGGRRQALNSEHQDRLRQLAGKDPRTLGLPWTCWSVAKMHEAAVRQGIIPNVSREALRSALRRAGISYQVTKTWKLSSDPQFHEKYRQVKALYEKCPVAGVVVCVDEFGPLECRPYKGRTWRPENKPARLAATYHRTQGVRHLLAWYDVHHDLLGGWFYERKRGEEFLDFLKKLRGNYAPWVHIHVVLDNFSPHRRADVRAYAAAHRMSLVYIATNASWMNRIEAHFSPLRKFALENSHPKTHVELESQIADYMEWRNANPRDPRILKEQKKRRVA